MVSTVSLANDAGICSALLGTLNTEEFIAQASRPRRMPGRWRVFVAASNHVFAMMRLYSAHQDGGDERTPDLVRSLDAAFALLGTTLDRFKPVSFDGATRPETANRR